MKELLAYLVQNLVTQPDQVVIDEQQEGEHISLTLRVAPEDMGRVIGRRGRIAKELRVLLYAAANRENKRVSLDILD